MNKPKWKKAAILFGVVLLAMAGFAGLTAKEIYDYSNYRSPRNAQAAIVLGAALSGREPSPVFRERINHAIELYREGRVQKLIFTGGEGDSNQVAEADSAKAYALTQGVPSQDILTERESRTTYENLQNAREVAKNNNLKTFLVVSDPLHMRRAITIAKDLGMDADSSPTPTSRYISDGSKRALLTHEVCYFWLYKLRLWR